MPQAFVSLTLFVALIVGGTSLFAQVANVTDPAAAGASIEGLVTVADQKGHADAVLGVLVKLSGTSSVSAASSKPL